MNEQEVIGRLMQGELVDELAREYHVIIEQIGSLKRMLNIPPASTIKQILNYQGFKEEFTEIYNNSTKNSEIVDWLQQHPLFKRKRMHNQRISELRNLFGLSPKMPENVYLTQHDRIRGYMIRNTKFMAKRRGLEFNLIYQDLEIPEYCPYLGIKLTYMHESGGQDPSHASIDRIDNNKGYIKGNIIVVSRMANAMKNSASLDQLEIFCNNSLKLINFYKNQGALGSITDIFEDFIPKLSLTSSR